MAHDTTNEARRSRCPEDVLAWIPWYADGGLSAKEKGAVEAHAALCRDCRTEIDIVSGAAWALDGVDLPDAGRLFGEITARIEAEDRGERATVIPISRGRALSDVDMARIEQWVRDPDSEREESPRTSIGAAAGSVASPPGSVRPLRRGLVAGAPLWAAAAALALFAAGALAGSQFARPLLGLEGGERAVGEGVDYQLASAEATAARGGVPAIDVVFSDSATARQIRDGLRGLGVEIVSGPSNLGVFRLQLLPAAVEGRAVTTADAAAVAARLVAPDSPLAIFAEPVP